MLLDSWAHVAQETATDLGSATFETKNPHTPDHLTLIERKGHLWHRRGECLKTDLELSCPGNRTLRKWCHYRIESAPLLRMFHRPLHWGQYIGGASMNRRELMMFSGAALAAHEGLAQAQQVSTATDTGVAAATIKTLLKYNRAKSSHRLPKDENKLTKYVESLSSALSLTATQQQAASSIFLNAVVAKTTLKAQVKSARTNVRNAVFVNDSGAISQESANIGNLKTQLIALGANAHATFHQVLTPAQQQMLLQYRG